MNLGALGLLAVSIGIVLFPSALKSAPAPTGSVSSRSDSTNPKVTQGVLPNGLRYAIEHNTSPPGVVSLRFVIEAGSTQEAPDQEGLAHLLEHMAFRGSTHLPDGEAMKALQRLGVRPGADANASTGRQATTFRFDVDGADDRSVDTVLGTFRDIASELSLTQDAIDSERKVVLEELQERAGATQDIGLSLLAAEFPGSAYIRSPGGRPAVVAAATSQELRAFYDAYYRPERAIIVVVGDIDPASIEANRIKLRFSDWRGRGPAGQDPPPYLPTGRQRTVFVSVEPTAPETALSMMWIRPYAPDDETRAGRVKAWVRSIGEFALSTRMNEMKVAQGSPFVSAAAQPFSIKGVAEGESIAAHGVADLPTTIGILTAARRQLFSQGLTQAEVDDVIERRRSSLERSAAGQTDMPFLLNSPAIAQQLSFELEGGQIDQSDQQKLDSFKEATSGLTAESVSQALRADLAGEGPIITYVAGGGATDKTRVEQLLDASEAAPLAPYEPPAKSKWAHTDFGPSSRVTERRDLADLGVTFARFDNGVRLSVKKLTTAPGQVEVVVRFGHGRLDQPYDRIDSSDWAPILLQLGGLADLRVSEVSGALAGHRVAMFASAQDDAFTIGTNGPGLTTVPTSDLDVELQYLAASVTTPGWRSEGWNVLLNTVGQLEAANAANPTGVFDRNIRRLLHPGDGRWVANTAQDRAKFTPAAARAFIEPILKNAELEVLVVGDVTPDQAIDAVGRTFGALPRRPGIPEPTLGLDDRFPSPEALPVVIQYPGRPDQAIAEVSWPTTGEVAGWEDVAPSIVLADVLKQRVIDKLRTELGDTYSPSAGADFSRIYPAWGRLSLLVRCAPDKIGQVYAAIDAIAADLSSTPIDADELARALRPEVESAAHSQQMAAYWVAQLAGAQMDPRRIDFIRQTLPRLQGVTPADVLRVATKWLKANRAFRIEIVPSPSQ